MYFQILCLLFFVSNQIKTQILTKFTECSNAKDKNTWENLWILDRNFCAACVHIAFLTNRLQYISVFISTCTAYILNAIKMFLSDQMKQNFTNWKHRWIAQIFCFVYCRWMSLSFSNLLSRATHTKNLTRCAQCYHHLYYYLFACTLAGYLFWNFAI